MCCYLENTSSLVATIETKKKAVKTSALLSAGADFKRVCVCLCNDFAINVIQINTVGQNKVLIPMQQQVLLHHRPSSLSTSSSSMNSTVADICSGGSRIVLNTGTGGIIGGESGSILLRENGNGSDNGRVFTSGGGGGSSSSVSSRLIFESNGTGRLNPSGIIDRNSAASSVTVTSNNSTAGGGSSVSGVPSGIGTLLSVPLSTGSISSVATAAISTISNLSKMPGLLPDDVFYDIGGPSSSLVSSANSVIAAAATMTTVGDHTTATFADLIFAAASQVIS